jgi:hypothetical protein
LCFVRDDTMAFVMIRDDTMVFVMIRDDTIVFAMMHSESGEDQKEGGLSLASSESEDCENIVSMLAPKSLKELLEEPSARPAKRLNSWRARTLHIMHTTWSTVAGTRAPHSHSLSAQLAVHAQEWPQPFGSPVTDAAAAAAAARLNSGNSGNSGEEDQQHRHTRVSIPKATALPTMAACSIEEHRDGALAAE